MDTSKYLRRRGGDADGRISLPRVILCCAVVAVAISSVYVFYNLNGDSFSLSDRQALLIVTDSMDGDVDEYQIDSFPADTMVMIRQLSDEEKLGIEVGDVLSFHQGNILNHHRVTDVSNIESGYVTTKGDNNPSSETVLLSDVNGEVIGTNHWLGVLVSFVKEYIIFLVLASVFVAISVEILRWALRPDDNSKEA